MSHDTDRAHRAGLAVIWRTVESRTSSPSCGTSRRRARCLCPARRLSNRAELLDSLAELRSLLPLSLEEAGQLLAERRRVLDEAYAAADGIVAEAHLEQEHIVSRSRVSAAALEKARAIVTAARDEADALRRDIDDYVDAKLANFEVVLGKLLASVREDRDRLQGASPYDQLAPENQDRGSPSAAE